MVETIPLQVTVRGAPIQYWRTTLATDVPGEADAVVLVHGLSGSSRWWAPVVPVLARHFDIYTVDLPGFGTARHLWHTLSFHDLADWLAEWLTALDLGPVHLVGHSMGGAVAARLAATHPEQVRRLVLVSAAIFGVLPIPSRTTPSRTAPLLMALRQTLPLARSARSARPRFLPVVVFDAVRAGPFSLWQAGQALLHDRSVEHLDAITTPTLLLWGNRDYLVPLEIGQRLQRRLLRARLRVLAGAGHIPMYERTAQFNEALLRFLTSAADPASPPPRSHPHVPSHPL